MSQTRGEKCCCREGLIIITYNILYILRNWKKLTVFNINDKIFEEINMFLLYVFMCQLRNKAL